MFIGASIGIAIAPFHGTAPEDLFRNADRALYEVKASGRNGWQLFDDKLQKVAQERRELERDLGVALARGQFVLHYQPVVPAHRPFGTGFEALVRWRHPRRGLVTPDMFIAPAEKSGLIVQLGQWVLAQACRDAMLWHPHIKVAVNVSPAQLGQPGFVNSVKAVLADTGLAPDRLEIEVTETVLIGNDEAVLEDLWRLHDMNVSIALDDFGTGYSSLSYLRRFPFDKIKIDRFFVRDIETDMHSAAIVTAITSMASSLGVITTAEGVETERQLELLSGFGCTTLQGYLLSPPVPAGDLAKFSVMK